MSFNTALTGLNAATADLNVKSNNSLDLAISGNGQGFYALAPALDTEQVLYSRAGAFNIDRDGYITNSSGQYLLGFPVNADGSVSSTALGGTNPIRLPVAAGVPQATTEVDIAANLPSTATDIDPVATPIDPNDPLTYTNSTSSNIFDSLGNESTLTYYYQKTNVPNEWNVQVYINEPTGSQTLVEFGAGQTTKTLTFDPALGGALDAGVTPTETYTFSGLSSGAVDLSFEINFAGSTQNSAAFTVLDTDQNGFPTGRLTGLDITAWEATLDSGDVRIGEAGTGSFGLIQSGALETSNVDLTKELVGLITAQRNFQANSKAIETNNAITQTIINLR